MERDAWRERAGQGRRRHRACAAGRSRPRPALGTHRGIAGRRSVPGRGAGEGYLAGLHGDDPKYLLAASTLKHWLANNNEAARNTTSASVDDCNLREYYAYPFQEAIQKGRAQGIMTAYNKVNNVPAAVSPLVKSLIIGQWGFDGLVCTDAWTANSLVNDQALLHGAGGRRRRHRQVGDGRHRAGGHPAHRGLRVQRRQVHAGRYGRRVAAGVARALPAGDLDPASYVPYKKIAGTETPWTTPNTSSGRSTSRARPSSC